MIEDFAEYQGQSRCAPKAKRGVRSFRRVVLRVYPGTTSFGISRDCSVGGTSEHKEGRAWDWGVDATDPKQKAQAEDLLEWLLKEDRFGNPGAMARRLGIMYIVWNRELWGSWSNEWRVYCVQRKKKCKSPTSGAALHPHTDHVHFSFSWAGARKRTSFWHKDRSMVAGVASSGPGYLLAGGNGAVIARDTAYHGARTGLPDAIVDVASTPSGGGYWLVAGKGRVFPFGDTRRHGRVKAEDGPVVGMASSPTGRGYWAVTGGGRVHAFGDAQLRGEVESGARIVDVAATPTGRGYWLFAADGRVFPFGDASFLGDARGEELSAPVVAGAPRGADGYWLVTEAGKVRAFGAAHRRGQFRVAGKSPVVGIAPTASGEGYRLVRANGRIRAFGDAR